MSDSGGQPDVYEVMRSIDRLKDADKKRVLAITVETISEEDRLQLVPDSLVSAQTLQRENAQKWLGYIIIVGFVATVVGLVVGIAAGWLALDTLQSIASVYSGLTGAVIGFF